MIKFFCFETLNHLYMSDSFTPFFSILSTISAWSFRCEVWFAKDLSAQSSKHSRRSAKHEATIQELSVRLRQTRVKAVACEVYEHKRMAFPLVLPSTRSFVSSDEKRPLQKTDTRFYFHFSKSDFLPDHLTFDQKGKDLMFICDLYLLQKLFL